MADLAGGTEVSEVYRREGQFDLIDEYVLQSTEVHDFGLQARFEITHRDRTIGSLMLHYNPAAETVTVGLIRINEENHRRKGVGTAVYRSIPDLPIPAMRWHRQDRATLISGNLNEMSRGLWEKMVRNGLAVATEEGYRYIG